MAQLNTRIILRNDSTINWEAQSTQVLLKGEVGIEFLADGSAKLKIGDGVKSWAELDYFGGEFDTTAIDNLETKLRQLEEILGEDGETPTGVFEELAELRGQIETNKNDLDIVEGAIGDLELALGAPATEETPATGFYADRERLNEVEEDVTNLNTALAGKANIEDVYTKEEVYTKAEVIAQIADIEHLKRKIVKDVAEAEQFITENPLTADQYIYMVPVEKVEDGDKYDEYLVVDGKLERVGDWSVDLSDYAKVEDLDNLQTQVGSITDEMVDFIKGEDLVEALAVKADKTELEAYAKLTDIEEFVTSEAIDNLTTIINGKVTAEEGMNLVADDQIAKLLTVEANAQPNFVKAVDETQLKVDEAGKLSVIKVNQALIGGLVNKAGTEDNLINILGEKANKAEMQSAVDNINTILANKADKSELDKKLDIPTDGSRLITEAEGLKLAALTINGDKVEISGSVNASNVQELYDAVVHIVTGTGEGTYDGLVKELLGVEKGAQVNVIEKVTLAGGNALIVTDKAVDIPVATIAAAGVVKSAEGVNKITVAADGTMEVNSLNVNKLVQDEGDYVVLNGGNSKLEY